MADVRKRITLYSCVKTLKWIDFVRCFVNQILTQPSLFLPEIEIYGFKTAAIKIKLNEGKVAPRGKCLLCVSSEQSFHVRLTIDKFRITSHHRRHKYI